MGKRHRITQQARQPTSQRLDPRIAEEDERPVDQRSERRITQQTERILEILASDPSAEFAGAEIERATKIAKGTIYPAMARMTVMGWLTWRWEEIDPSEAGRPRKRLYKITAEGEMAARKIENEAAARARARELKRARLRHAPGGAI